MTLEELGQLGEFVGAIGVVVSFVYLAVQIRQNTRQLEQSSHAMRLSVAQQIKRDNADLRVPMIQDADIARMLRVGLTDPESLDADDLVRFRLLLNTLFEHPQFTYERRNEGLFGWAYFEGTCAAYVSQPGFVEWWKHVRKLYNPEFVAFVDRQAEQAEETGPHFLRR